MTFSYQEPGITAHTQRISRLPRKSSLPTSRHRNRDPLHAIQYIAGKITSLLDEDTDRAVDLQSETTGLDGSCRGGYQRQQLRGLGPARAAGAAPIRALGVSDNSEIAAPGFSLPIKSPLEAAKHPAATTAEQALQPLPLRFSRSRSRAQKRSAALPAARTALRLTTPP